MKQTLVFLCALGCFFLGSTQVCAGEITATISMVYYECLKPESDPACVSQDEASKSESCPGCQAWKKVSIDTDVTATPSPRYAQPNAFLDDVSRQMYGKGLPANADGAPISVSNFYKNFEKYGWVEVGEDQPKEGAVALLPTTAGIVVNEDVGGKVTVVYSSTKRDGAIRKTGLSNLKSSSAEPKFVVPKAFLATAAGEKSSQ